MARVWGERGQVAVALAIVQLCDHGGDGKITLRHLIYSVSAGLRLDIEGGIKQG